MQKFEYITVDVIRNEVRVINGEQATPSAGLFGSAKRRMLHEYLNDRGREGWEVVGVSSTNRSAENDAQVWVCVILKRPIE